MEHQILTDEMIEELEASASEVATAVSADALRALAERTRDEARRRIRMRFHARWGYFFKCKSCGRRLESPLPSRCACGSSHWMATGYAGPGGG